MQRRHARLFVHLFFRSPDHLFAWLAPPLPLRPYPYFNVCKKRGWDCGVRRLGPVRWKCINRPVSALCDNLFSPAHRKMTLLVLTALLFGALTLAEHYQCSWDVLQGRTPEAAGFTRLCEPKLVEIEQYGSYRCTLYASLNDHEYGIATWNAKPKELEWGQCLLVRLHSCDHYC